MIFYTDICPHYIIVHVFFVGDGEYDEYDDVSESDDSSMDQLSATSAAGCGCIQMIVIGHLGINVYEELKYKMLSNRAVSFLFKLRPSELEVGSSRRQPFWILFYLLLLHDLMT